MNKIGFAISIFVFASCATGYHPKMVSGGYSSLALGSRKHLVTFEGNRHTTATQARDFAILRAAQICEPYGQFSVTGHQSDEAEHLVAVNGFIGIAISPIQTIEVECGAPGMQSSSIIQSVPKQYRIHHSAL